MQKNTSWNNTGAWEEGRQKKIFLSDIFKTSPGIGARFNTKFPSATHSLLRSTGCPIFYEAYFKPLPSRPQLSYPDTMYPSLGRWFVSHFTSTFLNLSLQNPLIYLYLHLFFLSFALVTAEGVLVFYLLEACLLLRYRESTLSIIPSFSCICNISLLTEYLIPINYTQIS